MEIREGCLHSIATGPGPVREAQRLLELDDAGQPAQSLQADVTSIIDRTNIRGSNALWMADVLP